MAGTPRSPDELEKVSHVGKMEFIRTYRYTIHELKLEVKLADPEQYVPRLASGPGLSDEAERQACQLLHDVKKTGTYSGKSPVGLAAAAVYAAALLTNGKVTQGEISIVADISEVIIRNQYKELLEVQSGTLLV